MSFEPSSVDLGTLPSIDAQDLRGLPAVSALYFVLDHPQTVLYVGKTRNLAKLWQKHRLRGTIVRHDACRIAWYAWSDLAWLTSMKAVCIAHFAPTYNHKHGPPPILPIHCVCPICGTEYDVIPHRLREGRGKTCSQACGVILRRRNPQWLASVERFRTSEEDKRRTKQRKNAVYRARHREKLRQKQLAYYAEHPEVSMRARLKRRGQHYNADIWDFTVAQWRALKVAYDFRCAYCGERFERLTKDHVIPLCKGGNHTLRNIVPACRACNASKWTHLRQPLISPEPFYDLIEV